MFKYYFTYWNDLPAGSGYAQFGRVHLTWLICILIVIIICCLIFTKRSVKQQRAFLCVLAIIMITMESYRETVLAITGNWEFSVLPLHLCGIAVFIEILYAFFPCTFLGEFMCIACLPGAASALLFPDWLRYPTLNFMNIHGFVMHTILVLIPLLVLFSGLYRTQIRRIWMVLLFFAIACPVLYRVNVVMHTDFMFLNAPSYGSPFEQVYRNFGYAAYMAEFAAVVFGVILGMYVITSLIGKIAGKGHSNNCQKR